MKRFPTHLMMLILPCYQTKTKIPQEDYRSYEYKCKNPQQTTRKPNLAIYKRIIHHDHERLIIGIWDYFNIKKATNVINHLKRIEVKNYMIILVDSEKKYFDEI